MSEDGNRDERAIWSLRIKEARTRDELVALDEALQATGETWIGALRIEIGVAKTRLKRAADAGAPGEAFAAAYGLPAPDGRSLYRYRLSEDAFDRLGRDLTRHSLAELGKGHRPALFVLWASEWFRRSYRGGGQRWSELCAALGLVEDQAALRAIAAAGLRGWRRPVLKAGSAREFLGSLAREGGFPAAAVEAGAGARGARGWAHDVLAAIVAPLLAEPAAGEERARALADAQRATLPQLFRDDDFLTLCADLALAIVTLRREAEATAAAAGLPIVAWLELNRPGWRERLPLTAGDRAAEALIEGLMTVPVVQGAAVGVDRLLLRGSGGWQEAVRLTLDGLLEGAATQALDRSLGRLRAFAAGEMARALPGEIAMLDAPGDGEKAWTARSTKRARGVQPLPFAAAVELDLRSGEQRVARIALAGGKPRRGELIVTVPEAGAGAGADDAPTLLRVVGSGSGRYRAETLVIQAPADWRADATAGESVTSLGRGAGDRTLWRVTGGAFFTDPSGDRFRILCGQPQEEPTRIELHGDPVRWAEVTGDVDLYAGPPLARIGSGGSLCVRPLGSRRWDAAPRSLPVGHYELGWRRDGIVLDRRRIAVLPAAAEVTRGGPWQRPSYRLAGFGACRLTPDDSAPVRVAGTGEWLARPASCLVHWFAARIDWPDAPPLSVRIDHPCAASIARWDGTVLPDQARITLAELSELVAVNAGRVQMVGELVSHGKRVAEMTWEVVDELPMASVAGDLASLLLPGSIDAEVRLGMHDGIETWWRLRQFPIDLARDAGGGLVATRGVVAADAQLVGRALARPVEEVAFGGYSLLTDANHRPAALPPLDGEWLVYLRAGQTILSRPLFHRGDAPAAPRGLLATAMANPPGPALDGALLALLDVAEGEGGGAIVGELLALVASLQGLPPATFRVLELLPRRQGALARLAMAAGPALREAVLALSDALPFAWCLIRRVHWQEAQGEAFASVLAQLDALGAEAPHFAKQAVDATVAALMELEPLLAPVLGAAPAEPIDAVVQAFMNRAVHRIPAGTGERYRGRLPDHLPGYFHRFDPGVLDTLDAPCAAAAAVADLWTPDSDAIRHIKTVARTFPIYFADGFAASLQEFA